MAEDLVQCSKYKEEVQNDEFYESWSSTQIKVIKLRHTWTISNFSFCYEENGTYLKSHTFSAGSNNEKIEWCLWIYPKGDNKETDNSISLFLILNKCSMDRIYAKFKCGIMKARGESFAILEDSKLFKLKGSWGWSDFIKHDDLFNKKNECLLDDKLTIFCEIIASVGRRNISGTLATPQCDLDFKFLFENKYLSDVILSADEKEFPAHKVILAVRSPVFRAMFQHDMEESRNNRVQITDIDERGLCEMLRYMYTGKINKLEDIAPHLLDVAEKYEMDDLKIICKKTLLKILSLENVVEIFILSDKFALTDLRNQVKKFIAAHGAVLGNIPEFQSILRTHPDLGIEAFCALNGNSSIN